MDQKEEVLNQLKSIIDPDLGKDIVSLGFIKGLTIDPSGKVSFTVELTTPACPVKEQFREDCTRVVSELSWVKNVEVTLSAQKQRSGLSSVGKGLEGVRYIIAVASCKGGVGKSTTAVNLAYSIAKKGATVGIFDADVYGPSLPTLIHAEFNGLFQKNELIIPVEYEGVKLMSFAYASAGSGGGPAVMRGPMVTQVINQLLTGTDWGPLDYLIIDMPPGTGDTQLTLSQLIPITASVIITTPQELSFVDVVKGIQMFDKMKIPTVAVVENMSYFICNSCDTKHEIFGSGSMKKIVEQFGIKNAFTVPILKEISELSDKGIPAVLAEPKSIFAQEYNRIVDSVVREISKVYHGNIVKPQVSFDQEKGLITYINSSKEIKEIEPPTLRRACKCARCVHELTGDRILNDNDVSNDIRPQHVNPMGNYAVAITWTDNHSSIYPFDALDAI